MRGGPRLISINSETDTCTARSGVSGSREWSGAFDLAARVGERDRGLAARARSVAEWRRSGSSSRERHREEPSLAVFRGGVRLRGKRKPASLGDGGMSNVVRQARVADQLSVPG